MFSYIYIKQFKVSTGLIQGQFEWSMQCKKWFFKMTVKLSSRSNFFINCPSKRICCLKVFNNFQNLNLGFDNIFFFFLPLSTKLKSVYAFGLCVCLSVHPRSNCRKNSSNVLKLIYVIYIWHSMNRIENDIYTTNGLSTETHKSFPIHYGLWRENIKSVF